jgi:arylsulfatase
MMMPRIPWDATPDTMRRFAPGVWDPDDDPVGLYYLPDDFTQARDLAAQHPDKVAELKALFWAAGERYKVLPLMGSLAFYFGVIPPLPTQSRFIFYGDAQNVASGMIPRIYNHSYTISPNSKSPTAAPRGCWWPRPTTWVASRCSSRTASCSTPTR